MTRPLLILRPEPGAGATAARAAAIGLDSVVAPLFAVSAVAWQPPDPAGFDAVLLTSANALRHGGEGLLRFRELPAYAVGAATAAAARDAGFGRVLVGDADAAALIARAVAAGARRLFHPVGREHRAPAAPVGAIVRRIVYASEAVAVLPDAARAALADGAVALLHSPRAAAAFRRLVAAAGIDIGGVRVAAISPAARAAAGKGWAAAESAARPRDDALLEAAARLCDQGRREGRADGDGLSS